MISAGNRVIGNTPTTTVSALKRSTALTSCWRTWQTAIQVSILVELACATSATRIPQHRSRKRAVKRNVAPCAQHRSCWCRSSWARAASPCCVAAQGRQQSYLQHVPIPFQRNSNELAPGSHVSFREQLLKGVLDPTLGNRHVSGDFFVGQALNDQPEYL